MGQSRKGNDKEKSLRRIAPSLMLFFAQPLAVPLSHVLKHSPGAPHYQRWPGPALGPAFGSLGTGLIQIYAQYRFLNMIEEFEKMRHQQYHGVIWARVDVYWLHPHPPLEVLASSFAWIPEGIDCGGFNDRHLVLNRTSANIVFRRWEAVLNGDAVNLLCYVDDNPE